jgi:beta-phosphoglucomutase
MSLVPKNIHEFRWRKLTQPTHQCKRTFAPKGLDYCPTFARKFTIIARVMFPATLFDYNGVLVDDEAVHLAAFRDVLAPLGVDVSEQAYWDRYIGFDDRAGFRAILEDVGQSVTEQRIAELVAAKRPAYLERAKTELSGFPGAADLVRRRHAVGPVAIVSGALREEVEFGLDHLGVRGLIDCIVAAEDTTASKPDPQGYALAVARLSASLGRAASERAVVIEDSLAGIAAAKSVGLPCIAVAHSYSRVELERSPADCVVDTIADIDDTRLADLYRRLYA